MNKALSLPTQIRYQLKMIPDTENLITGAAQKLADMMISDVCIQSPR